MKKLDEFLIEAKENTYANGNLDFFEGEETIFKNDEKIYSLKCHGGRVI